MTQLTTDRIRKSQSLTADEYKALVKWVNSQPTKVDAAILLGVTRPTLDRILIVKSCSPDSIKKIREVLLVDLGTA